MLLSFVLFVFINLIDNSFSVGNNTNIHKLSNNSFFNKSHSGYLKYTWSNGTIIKFNLSETSTKVSEVDCFGFGSTISSRLAWFYKNDGPLTTLDVNFYLTSRNQPRRVTVITGRQFGLEWTDFKIQRKTIIIVHGFLSHGEESWIKDMEKAFLLWGDVNVVVVDWSARGNTWNYYKAAVNARAVGKKINQFLTHVVNATRDSTVDEEPHWGSIHMIGHSLGAHICGVAAREFKKVPTLWKIKRITGLDPAEPCIINTEFSLDMNDAMFVDIIHTNGRLLSKLGFGLPDAIGHVDFYPNGGKTQPGCVRLDGFPYHYLGIPKSFVEQAICSHGRSYLYFTESIIAATNQNGTFWGYNWDRTYRRAIEIMNETCNERNCIEMGINADNYSNRGTFFVMTSSVKPFSELNDDDKYELSKQLKDDYYDDYLD